MHLKPFTIYGQSSGTHFCLHWHARSSSTASGATCPCIQSKSRPPSALDLDPSMAVWFRNVRRWQQCPPPHSGLVICTLYVLLETALTWGSVLESTSPLFERNISCRRMFTLHVFEEAAYMRHVTSCSLLVSD